MADLALFGISDDEAKKWIGNSDTPEEFEVLPENWETVNVFRSLCTQWRILVGAGGYFHQGLRYAEIPHVMDMMNVEKENRADVFEGLRVMESSALEVLNNQG